MSDNLIIPSDSTWPHPLEETETTTKWKDSMEKSETEKKQ
jgi:hypothetical protein